MSDNASKGEAAIRRTARSISRHSSRGYDGPIALPVASRAARRGNGGDSRVR